MHNGAVSIFVVFIVCIFVLLEYLVLSFFMSWFFSIPMQSPDIFTHTHFFCVYHFARHLPLIYNFFGTFLICKIGPAGGFVHTVLSFFLV